MKYQIYLNKETTEFINKLAEKKSKPASTLIKALIEDFVKLSKPLEKDILKEMDNNGKEGKQQ